MRPIMAAAALALTLTLGLAGCASSGGAGGGTSSGSGSDTSTSAPATDNSSGSMSTAVLKTASTDLGDIVVDSEGHVVYMFDKDTQGTDTSACTGGCLDAWPLVTTDATDLTGDGVTGEIGTIDTADGAKQLTLNGWPLYYYAKDDDAGDTYGQGVNDVWWVLSPAGERMAG